MTEQEWLAYTDPTPMLEFLKVTMATSERKLRLFACACHRRGWDRLHLFAREVVEVAERFADGLASQDDLDIAYNQAWVWPSRPAPEAGWIASSRAMEAAQQSSEWIARHFSWLQDPSRCAVILKEQRAAQVDLLRCIMGPLPFRPVRLDPSPLYSVAVGLATAIYAERTFDLMPALAAALSDAGYSDQDVLKHCVSGVHARGCWVVDLVLERG